MPGCRRRFRFWQRFWRHQRQKLLLRLSNRDLNRGGLRHRYRCRLYLRYRLRSWGRCKFWDRL